MLHTLFLHILAFFNEVSPYASAFAMKVYSQLIKTSGRCASSRTPSIVLWSVIVIKLIPLSLSLLYISIGSVKLSGHPTSLLNQPPGRLEAFE